MIRIPVSHGELFDKITILRIKQAKFGFGPKRDAVERELAELEICAREVPDHPDVPALVEELQAINSELWDIEEGKRDCEARQDFGAEFIRLARAVYRKNDRRAWLKRRLNEVTGSEIVEVKSHRDA